MIRTSLIALVLTLFTISLNAQGFLRAEGQQIVNDEGNYIIRSIGTGNWMIQEGYMMQSTKAGIHTHTEFRAKLEQSMGKEKTAEYYKHWLENHFTKRDLDSMKAWGFNALRPALHYKWFTLPIEEEPLEGENTWIETGFNMVDSLVNWAEANEMYIILDMHGTPGGQGKNADISDYNHNLAGLYESEINQDKLVALWVKLAERYKDNPWIGGYDFINEPNWKVDEKGSENGCGCENNDALWDLHLQLTKAVREVDQNHIVYISGNCWGNNYGSFDKHALNNYDKNTVITFHKYWNINNQESIQWAVDMREKYNRPLWMSEAGENSNQWFADAIHLFESNNIGWSWWPVKKSRLNNILKVTTPQSYDELIDSWKEGATPLSEDDTYKAIMNYSEAHKLANCVIAYDVINAMINNSDPKATLAFKTHKINEWVSCVDYDMGRDGFAYHDVLSENINDDTHHFRAWNEGNSYRNDGVDITKKDDYHYVGWTENGEWLQYTLTIENEGVYELQLETAAKDKAGIINIEVNGEVIATKVPLPATNDFENWESTAIKNIKLPKGEIKLRIIFIEGGSNLKAFKLLE